MKKYLLSFLFSFAFLSSFSQKSKNKDMVMPMGNGIYQVSKTGSSGFVNYRKLRVQAFEIVNEYAKKNNTEAEIITVNETPTSFGVFPSIDVKFRLVTNSKKIADSNSNTVSILSGYNAGGNLTESQIITNNSKSNPTDKPKSNPTDKPKSNPTDKLDRLEKIGKLYKEGLLTKEEFESEKKKILAED